MRVSRKCEICRFIGIFEKNKKSRVGRILCTLCEHWSMGSHLCVILLGLIGTVKFPMLGFQVITVLDIIRMMNYQLPGRFMTRRRSTDVVPANVERDLKLMTSILGIEHYTLIMLGAMTGYPMLHTPWLLMQLCVIAVEIGVFLIRLILDGLHIKLDGILLAIFTVHNWLQVFCLFHRQIENSYQ
ncbi:uncharacterized protein [Fopius arisanus]|uniref:Uncharacterized protein n=1 Tax=Fopius arisanus TaxID=64838 RepID=A0A9R1SWH0_9HYME|nr:PREDICTED: uncharacterized protein LOC105263826 [Fopius arisanus]